MTGGKSCLLLPNERKKIPEHELRNLPKQISGSLRNLQNKVLGHKKCIAFLCVLKIFRIFNTQEPPDARNDSSIPPVSDWRFLTEEYLNNSYLL